MTNCQVELERACRELGLKIIIPFELELESGKVVRAEALLPELGYLNGHLVSTNWEYVKWISEIALTKNYGLSIYGEPRNDNSFDLQSYIEMFSDWGWNSDEKKPSWMIETEDSE